MGVAGLRTRTWAIGLGAILALGAVLRLWDLNLRGFIYWDEGKFALEGVRLYGLIFHHALAGKTIGTSKPTHALLIALAYSILGVRDIAPLALDVTCSLASIVVLACLTARLFDRPTALLAALFLAASEYDIIYARSALSEADATLFFLLSVLVYVVTRQRQRVTWRLLPALLGGVAFTVNYRMLVYLLALAAFDIILTARSSGLRQAVPAVFIWGLGFAGALLVWQTIDLFARERGLVLFRYEMTGRPALYLQQTWYQTHEGKQSRVLIDPGAYIAWYIVRQGPASLLLLIGGIVVALRLRSLAWLLPATLVVVPFAVFAFAPFIVPRNLEATIPFACLLSAAMLLSVARAAPWPRLRPIALSTLALLLVVFGLVRSLDPITERSGFARASGYLHTHHVSRVLATSEIMVFYLGAASPCNVLPIPHSYSVFRSDVAAGYDYAVVDHAPHYVTERTMADIRHDRIAALYTVLGSTPHVEDPIASENNHVPGERLRDKPVKIYSLESRGASSARAGSVRCDPNRVL